MSLSDRHLEEYEKSLGLPAGFIDRLEKEGDDWSFTIKAHALAETGLTELIVHSIGKSALDEMLSKLPITGQFSKVAICRALNVLVEDIDVLDFISVLSVIRNRLVHNIRRVDFSLNDYFQQMHDENKTAFLHHRKTLDLLYGDINSLIVDGNKVDTVQLFKEHARLLISRSLGMVLVRIHFATTMAKWSKDSQETVTNVFSRSVVDELLKQHGHKLLD
jgi:hypothetical protein